MAFVKEAESPREGTGGRSTIRIEVGGASRGLGAIWVA